MARSDFGKPADAWQSKVLEHPSNNTYRNVPRIGSSFLRREALWASTPTKYAMTSNAGKFLELFQLTALIIVLLLALVAPLKTPAFYLVIQNVCRRIARKPWLACLVVGLTSVLVNALFSAIRWPVPSIHDEFSYLLGADTFAHGRLTNPPHPMWHFFESFHVIQQPTYASKYPPALSLLLAAAQVVTGTPVVGLWVGMGLASAATCWMLQGWISRRWAFAGGMLVALHSGMAIWWGQFFWGGSVPMLGGALLFGAWRRMLQKPRFSHGCTMAMGLIILANSRPCEGLIASLPIAAHLVWWLIRTTRSNQWLFVSRVMPSLVGLLALAGAWMAYYNQQVTGDPLTLPYQVHERQYAIAPIFLFQDPSKPEPVYRHNVLRGAQQGWLYSTYKPQRMSLGFARVIRTKLLLERQFYPEVLFTPTLLLLPWILRRRGMPMAIAICMLLLGVQLVETFMSPAYISPVASLFFLYFVQGLRQMYQCSWHGKPSGSFIVRSLFSVYAISLCVAGTLLFRGESRGSSANSSTEDMNGSNPRSTTNDSQRKLTVDWHRQRAAIETELNQTDGLHLVLVRYRGDHNTHHEWVYNGADIDGAKVVWARETPAEELPQLLEYFSDRKIWLVEADLMPATAVPYQAAVRK
jgi:hypothetical protein